MKTVLGLIALAALVAWGWPAIALSEKASIEYLDELDALSVQGQPEKYCEHMHDDLLVAVRDATSTFGAVRIDGGKKEWCDYIASTTEGMSLLGMKSRVTRHDFTVTRRWQSPWTARVAYQEQRTSEIASLDATLDTVSTDEWTLVQTLSGIKVLSLKVDSRIAP